MITLRSGKKLKQVQKSYAEPVHQKDLIREVKESQENISDQSQILHIYHHIPIIII